MTTDMPTMPDEPPASNEPAEPQAPADRDVAAHDAEAADREAATADGEPAPVDADAATVEAEPGEAVELAAESAAAEPTPPEAPAFEGTDDADDGGEAADSLETGAPSPEPMEAAGEAPEETAEEIAAEAVAEATSESAGPPAAPAPDEQPVIPTAAPEPETATAAVAAPTVEERGEAAPAAAPPLRTGAVRPPVAPPGPAPTPRNAGRFIAEALAAAGVRLAFTVPGESFLPLLDALPEAGIRVVAARHEGGAAFMATGAAALTGRPVAVLATRAVGASNLAIGLHTAFADSAPVIALVGQVRRGSRGREAFQEIDLAATIGRLCRWATEVRDVAALPGAIDEALRRATTARPGPVLVALPEDVLDEDVSPPNRAPSAASSLGPPRSPGPDPTTTRRVMHLLLDAERPVVLAGAGVLRSRGTADLVKLAELVDVPVVAAWRRPDVFPNDHPLYLGMTGYFAAPTVRERLAAADAILVIGCRLNEVASYGWTVPSASTRWAHVDLEPLGARPGLAGPTIALSADARTFLREARRILNGSLLDYGTLTQRRAANSADRAAFEEARRVDATAWDGPGVHPGRVIATLNAVLAPDAIVTTDAGNFAGWGARGLILRRPGTYIGPSSGAMGFGIPAAVAASIANPGRPVVALAGDGGAAMTFAELETAVREHAHPVVLVFDNARYGTIRDHQDSRGHHPSATDLGQVDWAAAARALGADGILVDDDAGFEPALRAALGSLHPTVIHLPIDRRWVSVDRLDDRASAERTAPVLSSSPVDAVGDTADALGDEAGDAVGDDTADALGDDFVDALGVDAGDGDVDAGEGDVDAGPPTGEDPEGLTEA